MLFNSHGFVFFFLPVYALYLILPRKQQNVMLLLASYLFYAFWDWRFLSLILLSTAVNFLCGRTIGREEEEHARKRTLVLCIIFNITLLAIFKYFNFFTDTLQVFLWAVGIHATKITLDIILPLGISFYTFQAMTYPIDIHRKILKPTNHLGDFALFVAFFPNLIAGPIERARNMLPQIEQPRSVASADLAAGSWLILWGLFKKIVVADNLAKATAIAFNIRSLVAGETALLVAFVFAFQIYADFSGYSDMARGLARLMGFNIMQNFRTPFFSTNLYDLWQRWHISLTTWIKEYVYYPLALMKIGPRQLAAPVVVIITWAIMGLWHGAEWKFVIWGLYHGALIILYNKLRPYIYRIRPKNAIAKAVYGAVSAVFVFTLFSIGLIFFAADSTERVFEFLGNMSSGIFNIATLDMAPLGYALPLILPIVILESFQFARNDELVVLKWPLFIQIVVCYVVFYYIIVLGNFSAQPYYYFQF